MQYLNLLRRPGPLLLWVGQVTSTAGDRLYMMAMLWLALQLTGSTQSMAAVSLFESIPLIVVGLIGGALIDRRDRLRLMIGIDLMRAVLVLALPLLYLAGQLHTWHLMAVAVGMGALGALFDPTLQAVLPGMVAPGEFAGLAGLMDTPSRFARLLGPGLAGILLTFMPAAHFFTLDAASFAVSAICLIFVALRWPPRARPETAARPPRNFLKEIPIGWWIMRSDSNLLAFLAVDGVGNLGFPAYTLGALLLATGRLNAGVGGYGLLLAAYGVGSLAGNFAVGNTRLGARPVPLAIGGWIGIGLGFAVLGVAPSLPWAIAGIALSGTSGAMAHVSRAAYIGSTVPPEHLGKVHSFKGICSTLSGAAGTLLCGWLLDWTAPGPLISIAGVMMVLASAIALTGWGWRSSVAAGVARAKGDFMAAE